MIAKAKRIDSDEVVEGYYFLSPKGYARELHIILVGSITFNIRLDESNMYEIDPSTLEYSFNGTDFYNEEAWKLFHRIAEVQANEDWYGRNL